MTKTLVYFVDLTHTGTITNADTFPYGVGCVAAYAKQQFGEDVEVEIFKLPADLNAGLKRRPPDVICFSNYVWNYYLTTAFARHVRDRWPRVPIVMGGPNISITAEGRREFLKANPWVDFYIKFEGEHALSALLGDLRAHLYSVESFKSGNPRLDNVLYLSGDEFIEGSEKRISDLSTIPSPYLTGILDKFFDQGLRPLVEFTRGCPYACTFCTDFHPHKNKIYWRGPDSARQEMEYIASRIKTPVDMVLADLNFGQYVEDIEVSKIIRATIDKHDWPHAISCSPGKSHADRVLECVKIINGDDRGVIKFGSSVQSTDPTVLSAISRKNLPIDRLRPMMEAANGGDEYTEFFTEMILALPEDSLERHRNSLRDTIDTLGMNIINVHQLTLLQGSPMALPEQREKYGFNVRQRVFVGCVGTYEIGDESVPIAEIEEVVVGNKTMTFDEWLDCRVMSLLVKIYIDRDYFIEVFGLMRRLGLSSVELLEKIRRVVAPRHPKFSALVARFREKTIEPLHDTLDEILSFVNDPVNVEKFRTGELGGNELLVHRAMAYLDHNDELHMILEEAARLVLREHGKDTYEMRDYLSQAVQFSSLRKFNPRNSSRELSGRFAYDFLLAKSKHFQVLPEEVRLPAPRSARFFFNKRAQSEIDYAVRTWVKPKTEASGIDLVADAELSDGQAMFSYGKLFHLSNLRVLNRSVEFLA